MAEAIAAAEFRPWNLSALAEEDEFDAHVELTAMAIADRFTLKAHINLAERRKAYDAWIDGVRAADRRPLGPDAFVAACAAMIAALSARRAVMFSAMIRTPGESSTDTILAYANEVTALAAGAAIYVPMLALIAGPGPHGDRLSTLVIGNAAAALRRRPEAALRFRELLRLPSPWDG